MAKSLWSQLYDLECTNCGHPCIRHTANVGPCEVCVDGLQIICEQFQSEKTAELIEALFKEANPYARN